MAQKQTSVKTQKKATTKRSAFHVFTRYVKVSFFRGSSLTPIPPGASKQKEVRYLDIYEDDEIDEAQMAKWLKQSAKLPGWLS